MHKASPFSDVDRIKLTNSIIEADDRLGGANLPLRYFTSRSNHPVAAYFPLHQYRLKNSIKEKVSAWRAILFPVHNFQTLYVLLTVMYFMTTPFMQPLPFLRSYYGEQV